MSSENVLSSNMEYFTYIHAGFSSLIDAIFVESKNEEKIFKCTFKSAIELLEKFPILCTTIKAVIVAVHQYDTPEFSDNLQFCKALKLKLDSINVPNYFMTWVDVTSTRLLISLNPTLKINEVILSVFINTTHLSVDVFELTEDGYKIVDKRMVFVNQKEEDPQTIRQKILGSWNPKKIVLRFQVDTPSIKKFYRDILKSKKLVVFDNSDGCSTNKFIMQKSKWLLNKSYTKFYIFPICAMRFDVAIRMNNVCGSLLSLENDKPLPYKKSAYLSRIYANNLFFGNGFEKLNWSPIPLEQECHGYNITLTVDNESFPKIEYELIMLPKVTSLPEKLNASIKTKPPVIGLFGCSSVICVYKDDGYKFLDVWNGQYGKDLVIAFDKEKPSFCENALPSFIKKQSCVIFDILNIMAMPADADGIKADKLWTFTVTKDAEHPVLLEFDNYDGAKKAASPAFYMAMLFKQHLKAIKAEIGEKPKEIGLCVSRIFEDVERARIESKLQECCELLKIGCTFICCM